jgi:hypothetical protein
MIGAALILAGLEAALGGIALLLSRRRPASAALGLLAVTAPLEVYRTPVLGANLSLFRISLAVGLAVLICGPDLELRRHLRDPITLGYAFLTGVMATSLVFVSDNRSLGLRVFSQVAVGTAAVVVVAGLARRIGSPARVAGTLAAGAVLPVLAGFWQASFGSSPGAPLLPLLGLLPAAAGLQVSRDASSFVGNALRVKATFADPNHFGAYCALLLGPVLSLAGLAAARRAATRSAVAGVLALALACMILLSGSRSAWLAAAVCAVGAAASLLPPLLRGTSGRARVRIVAASVLALAVLAGVGAPVVGSRLDDASAANHQSDRTHSLTLRKAADDLLDHPVFGIGIADFGPQLGEAPLTSGAHSTYLTVGAELGGVGLLALLTALAATGRALAAGVRGGDDELRAIAIGLVCGYAGFAVAAFFYDLWWDDFQWVLAGTVLGLCGATTGRLRLKRTVSPRRLAVEL